MWVRVSGPELGSGARVTVARLHAHDGERLAPGSALIDLEVDLGGGIARDCPPVSTCRIVLREALWLRRLHVRAGDTIAPGTAIGDLSDTADAAAAPPARTARVTLAAVVYHPDWWSDAR